MAEGEVAKRTNWKANIIKRNTLPSELKYELLDIARLPKLHTEQNGNKCDDSVERWLNWKVSSFGYFLLSLASSFVREWRHVDRLLILLVYTRRPSNPTTNVLCFIQSSHERQQLFCSHFSYVLKPPCLKPLKKNVSYVRKMSILFRTRQHTRYLYLNHRRHVRVIEASRSDVRGEEHHVCGVVEQFRSFVPLRLVPRTRRWKER